MAQANGMQLSVRTLAVEEGDMPTWYVTTKDKNFEPLQWSSNQLSTAIMANADRELILYSKEDKQNGEPEFMLAKKVTIPEAADEVLLLGWPIEEDKQFEVLAIADDHRKANFNDWLVINRSDQAVTLRYGKENDPIQLEPGEAKAYRIKGEHDKGEELLAEAMVKGELKKMYSTFWSAPNKQRSIVLFYSKDDRPKLRRIIDFFDTEKP